MMNWLKQIIAPAAQPGAPVAAKALQSASKATSPDSVSDLLPQADSGQPQLRFARLIMVTAENNNKYYEMQETTDEAFSVRYGRVGGSCVTTNYPIREWDAKLREKLRKGYKDHTQLVGAASELEDFLEIGDASVKQLMEELAACSRQSIFRNYNVAADQVSRRQVEKAQALLDRLVGQISLKMEVKDFNEGLLELYQIIPRKMKNVREHLVETPKSAEDLAALEKKLAEEQATLDVMRGEVDSLEQQKEQSGKKLTLLEAHGLQIEPVTDNDLIRHIQKMMGDERKKFSRAFKLTNLRTQQSFDNQLANSKNKKAELFWHGSRNENWLSIIKTGLVLRPANAVITGKMFGYGLYFADKFRKSLNYTSLQGSFWANGSQNKAYLALYDVHLGKALKVKSHEPWCGNLSAENLKKRGKDYDSVFAEGGADLINNEFIVYNQAQCTIRYLVEVKN